MRIHRTDYTQKPGSGVIDWSRPDAIGLAFFCPFFPYRGSDSPPYTTGGSSAVSYPDLVSNLRASPNPLGNNWAQPTLGGNGVRNINAKSPLQWAYAPSWAQQTAITVGLEYVPYSAGYSSDVWLGGNAYDDGEGGFFRSGWGVGCDYATSAINAYVVQDNYAQTVAVGSEQITTRYGKVSWLWLTWSTRSQTLRLFGSSGVQQGSTRLSIDASYLKYEPASDICAGCPTDFVTRIGDAVLQLRVYNRELSQPEIQSVIAEPWRIIQQPGARRYFVVGAGATRQFARPYRDVVGA